MKEKKQKDQLRLFMVACESMKDILKQQTLKGPRLIQFEQGVVCKWLTLMCLEGKPMTEPMIIEGAKSFYGEMKIADK
jgi:hypothetical protein